MTVTVYLLQLLAYRGKSQKEPGESEKVFSNCGNEQKGLG